jgi:hypothetical protein
MAKAKNNSFEQPLDNEPAAAYAKFVIYRDLGMNRSLRKAYRLYLERQEGATQVGKGLGENLPKKEVKHLPGQWVRLSKLYQWHKRADDFDWNLTEQREKEQEKLRKKAIKEQVDQIVEAQFEGYSFDLKATNVKNDNF